MPTNLQEAFTIDNMRRAWSWLNTNPDSLYKSYFRHIYRAYAIAAENNLVDLRKRLKEGSFQATLATKLYIPKKSGIQRTYTLLTVEDQIVYQALINVVAEKLVSRVKNRYYKEVFGHLYSGQRSQYFYRDWRNGYDRFSDSIRGVYSQGFTYTASFDLTACYDSIDHHVLGHFLDNLGLQREFIDLLCDYLKTWTATSAQGIYQGHGIPQGPLSSGLLSEVVLRHFDENRTSKPRNWRYFRYVDDIRFFAKNEHDLRLMLVEMDLLSKQIGLFPQSGKIEIHKVVNIDDEIKSLSNPIEPSETKTAANQLKIQRRIIELSPRYEVKKETRFKYALGRAEPSAVLNKRLVEITKRQPHLYIPIFNYFSKYRQIPKVASNNLLDLLKKNGLYSSFTAAGLRTLHERCHPIVQSSLDKFAKDIMHSPSATANPELRTAALAILITNGLLSWQDINKYLTGEKDWWAKADLIRHVQIKQIGPPSYESLMNQMLEDISVDVSIISAELIAVNELDCINQIDKINPIAQLTLKKMGLINIRRGGPCPISASMQSIFDTSVSVINWKKMMGQHYKPNISKAIRLRAYSQTDATAWVNLLDTIHDDLLDTLFIHNAGVIGTYQHGNIGSVVLGSPKSKFCQKYPMSYKIFRDIHEKRLESLLSHSFIKSTGKRTHFIPYEYIKKTKPQLLKAYIEIWNK